MKIKIRQNFYSFLKFIFHFEMSIIPFFFFFGGECLISKECQFKSPKLTKPVDKVIFRYTSSVIQECNSSCSYKMLCIL